MALMVSAGSREIRIQERLPLRVKARYSDGNEKGLSSGIEWRLSDASIASIDSRGELLGCDPAKSPSSPDGVELKARRCIS